MKSVENLEGNDLLIVEARKVRGGKVQLAFAQKVENPNARPSSIAGLLNASDERFNAPGKPRYAYMGGTAQDIKASLGIDVSGLQNEGDTMDLSADPKAFNPEIGGKKLNIQITETTQGNEYELANIEKAAKKAGAEGEHILTQKGEYIFMRATVVAGQPKHVFITDTVRASEFAAQDTDSIIDDELSA